GLPRLYPCNLEPPSFRNDRPAAARARAAHARRVRGRTSAARRPGARQNQRRVAGQHGAALALACGSTLARRPAFPRRHLGPAAPGPRRRTARMARSTGPRAAIAAALPQPACRRHECIIEAMTPTQLVSDTLRESDT